MAQLPTARGCPGRSRTKLRKQACNTPSAWPPHRSRGRIAPSRPGVGWKSISARFYRENTNPRVVSPWAASHSAQAVLDSAAAASARGVRHNAADSGEGYLQGELPATVARLCRPPARRPGAENCRLAPRESTRLARSVPGLLHSLAPNWVGRHPTEREPVPTPDVVSQQLDVWISQLAKANVGPQHRFTSCRAPHQARHRCRSSP